MRDFRHLIPSPSSLVTFEAAARLQSFSRAAEELGELLDKTLIHLEEPYRRRISWKDWFRHFGIDYELPTHGLQLNDYAVVLQAAIAGQGIALGWRHLVSHLLRSGQLRRAVKHSYRSAKAFYVVTPKVWPVNEATQLFRDWMIAEARRDKLSGEEEGVAV